MELLEGKDLRNCMLKGYTNNPKGWSFVVSPSPTSGFFDATVSGPDATWILKIDSMFRPCPIVIGSQAEAGPLRPESPFSYGYRKLPPNLVLQLLGDEDGASRDKRGWLASCLCSGRNHGCRRRGKATLRVPSC